MKHFVESHMNLCLILGCALGLVWPYWGGVPDAMVILLIMGATLIACFRINAHELKQVPWRFCGVFYAFRYLLLPLLIYGSAGLLFEKEIALGLMLIAALPVGASAPAMAHVFGGQVSLTAVFTLFTTLLAPLAMPALFMLVGDDATAPPLAMFITLIIALVVPCVVFLYVRRYPRCHTLAAEYGKAATILMISLMIAIVVGKQRHMVLAEPLLVLQLVVLTFALLTLLLLAGWFAGVRLHKPQQIALVTASGFNNIGLGVAMALLHFTPMVVLVAIATEIAWALLPLVILWL